MKRPRIRAGGFYFSRGFAARSRALRARISRLRRSCARLDKTAMLRRLLNIMRYDSKSLGRKFIIDIVGYRPERRQATMFVTYAEQNRMDASRFLKWLQVWT